MKGFVGGIMVLVALQVFSGPAGLDLAEGLLGRGVRLLESLSDPSRPLIPDLRAQQATAPAPATPWGTELA